MPSMDGIHRALITQPINSVQIKIKINLDINVDNHNPMFLISKEPTNRNSISQLINRRNVEKSIL